MLSFYEKNFSWITSQSIFPAKSQELYSSVTHNFLNALFNNKKEVSNDEERKPRLTLFNRSISWPSSPSIFPSKSQQFSRFFTQNFLNTFRINAQSPHEEELRKERLTFYELVFARLRKPPPPPPSAARTFFEKFLHVLRLEGTAFTREVVSASAASVISVLVTHPLDAIKSYYLHRYGSVKMSTVRVLPGLRLCYDVRKMYRERRIRGFFFHHMDAQRDSLFHTVSMFYTQQRVYQELHQYKLNPDVCCFVSGFLSATIAVLALKPFAEYIDRKSRIKYLLKRYGPIEAAYVVRRRESFFSLFRGCFPEFMFLGTQYGLRFLLYNELRNRILGPKNEIIQAKRVENLNPVGDYNTYRTKSLTYLTYTESILAGAISGVVSDLLSHPLEVISARLHWDALSRQQYHYTNTCRHYYQCVWLILRQEKLKGLFTGFTPTLWKSMIGVALQFAVYNKVEAWLDEHYGLSKKPIQ